MNLSASVAASAYLSGLLKQFPEYQPYVNGAKPVVWAELNLIGTAVDSVSEALLADGLAFSVYLRAQKSRFSLLWALASFSRSLSFAELGQAQSDFAGRCIEQALNAALQSPPIVKFYGGQGMPKMQTSGLFVLAMGKLGGQDLNFSSDVDLVAFYDKEKFPCPRIQGATFVITQILQMMTKILTGNGASELIWRVDWRLRPHSALRNLTMPAASADEFYHYHAQSWHRLAMIKARPIAGDIATGQQFLDDLRAFIWRHDLDYRALDDLKSLKHKINLEHPELASQRRQTDEKRNNAQGYNLKLGTGGIREIEFIVNALQLVWGGRKPELRQTNTLNSLACLADIGLYERATAGKLTAAYQFLRRAENAVQMLENTQRYHLPERLETQHNLLSLLGYRDWPLFMRKLAEHRAHVTAAFASLFADKRPRSGRENAARENTEWENTEWENAEWEREIYAWNNGQLNAQAAQIVKHWEQGFRHYGVPESYASSLKSLAKELDRIIDAAQLDVNTAAIKLDNFFHSLPRGGQYFRLLHEYPALIDKLIQPLLHADAMAILLQQSPHIIDRFLEECTPLKPGMPLDSAIIFYTQDFETRLQNLRRLANEELYLIYLQYFNAAISTREFEASLSYLAQCLLELCLQVTCDALQIKEPPIGVIGFGKLAMGAMMPRSDLDLVFLFGEMKDLQAANQFVNKLTTVIATPMKQGKVYELDTRLRPSGKSGVATVSLQSFEKHQYTQAHTWAHLALVPARFIAGNQAIGAQFKRIQSALLTKPRHLRQFKKDALKMLTRIKKQRILEGAENQFVSKLRSGGLSELEYLLCCQAVLQFQGAADKRPVGYDNLVKSISRHCNIALDEALFFMRDFQLEVRLFGDEAKPLNELSIFVKNHIKTVFKVDSIQQAEQQMQAYTKMVQQFDQQFFAEIDLSAINTWQEQSIQWL